MICCGEVPRSGTLVMNLVIKKNVGFIVSMTWSNENVVTLYIKEVSVMNDEFDFWGVGQYTVSYLHQFPISNNMVFIRSFVPTPQKSNSSCITDNSLMYSVTTFSLDNVMLTMKTDIFFNE